MERESVICVRGEKNRFGWGAWGRGWIFEMLEDYGVF